VLPVMEISFQPLLPQKPIEVDVWSRYAMNQGLSHLTILIISLLSKLTLIEK
jgi:hypothetical protein